MASYRAVLFDFFGTLTSAVTRGPWHAAIARQLGCDPAQFTSALDRSFRIRARGAFGTPEATLRWVCDQLGADPSDAALQSAQRQRVLAIHDEIRLRPDAVAALRAVRARGLPIAVVSDCGYELPVFWPWLPVAGLVDVCAFSVQVGACKPDPAMYRTACQKLGVAPHECLYIGDGGGQELTGATRLGMTAVRLAAADLGEHLVFAPDQRFAGPAAASLLEAVRFLETLPARTHQPQVHTWARGRPVPRQRAAAVTSRR